MNRGSANLPASMAKPRQDCQGAKKQNPIFDRIGKHFHLLSLSRLCR